MNDFLERYSRQMLLPNIGVNGQNAICNSNIVIIGAGGIGSSTILFLAAAGIGNLLIVDFDDIEISNLHRQIIHDSNSKGMNKAISAVNQVKLLNPTVNVHAYQERLTYDNALDVISKCDICIDCTDNVEARYIINDACVLLNKPLISGSAVGMEGQITIFSSKHHGPCYRCIHPNPSLSACQSCSNAGVLGPVPGLIGCLQAIECIKLLVNTNKQNLSSSTSSTTTTTDTLTLDPLIGRQLYYDATIGEFQTFLLRQRDFNCNVCGDNPTIRDMEMCRVNLSTLNINLLQCNDNNDDIDNDLHVSVSQYVNICSEKISHLLLDVRNEIQFAMISLKVYQDKDTKANNIINFDKNITITNMPLKAISIDTIEKLNNDNNNNGNIYVICRRGIDSITATKLLRERFPGKIYNIKGGLTVILIQIILSKN